MIVDKILLENRRQARQLNKIQHSEKKERKFRFFFLSRPDKRKR